jgi:hypothetical protein
LVWGNYTKLESDASKVYFLINESSKLLERIQFFLVKAMKNCRRHMQTFYKNYFHYDDFARDKTKMDRIMYNVVCEITYEGELVEIV